MELTIPIQDPSLRSVLYGSADRNLRSIRTAFDVRISARDSTVHIQGSNDSVHRAATVIEVLQRTLQNQAYLEDQEVLDAIERAQRSMVAAPGQPVLDVFTRSAAIAPQGEGQRQYVDAMQRDKLVFCLGPAGTGKTYLAVAVAVAALRQHQIKRIVLARPAVEAGEKLGFLPGDMQAKVNPYLRPLFDAMNDMMSLEQLQRFVQNDVVEVVPLAFMRGRTLNNAAIILDEAQNATPSQMLMFLTRMGRGSQMIVTGDDSQSDLVDNSGLIDAVERLETVEGIAVIRLTRQDIVRHPLVQSIVDRYGANGETPDNKKQGSPEPPPKRGS